MVRPHSMMETAAQARPHPHDVADATERATSLTAPVSADLSSDTVSAGSVPALRVDDVPDAALEESLSFREPLDPRAKGRFLTWSKRYVTALVALDALVGLLAVLVGPELPQAM